MFQVLEVISFRPLRSKVKNALVTAWFGEYGICDRLIYFDKTCLESCVEPQIGSKVFFMYKLFISYFLVDPDYFYVQLISTRHIDTLKYVLGLNNIILSVFL